jgi:hypothetical protein
MATSPATRIAGLERLEDIDKPERFGGIIHMPSMRSSRSERIELGPGLKLLTVGEEHADT